MAQRKRMVKPERLNEGDTIAVVADSWGGAHRFPWIYERGLRSLEENLGLKIKEYSTARMSGEELHRHPEKRAGAINEAFADEEVIWIFSWIFGGACWPWWHGRRYRHGHRYGYGEPEDIIKERYASGEINKKEYEEMLKDLGK